MVDVDADETIVLLFTKLVTLVIFPVVEEIFDGMVLRSVVELVLDVMNV
jgi:hypothetical protein